MKRLVLSLSCSVLALLPRIATAQVDTGSILGSVRDASGAAVTDATITITETKTNSSGDFIATPLRIGTYTVSVDVQGFKKATRSDVVLRVQDRLRMDFQLQVGDVAEVVVVSGEAPLIQTETSSLRYSF